jgi:chromosomal replication initiator protein
MVGSGHSAEPEPISVVSAETASVPNAGLTVADVAPALFQAFGTRLTVARIQQTVSEFYGVSPAYMKAPSTQSGAMERRVARPRQVAMFLSRELTDHSLPSLGKFFGRRDHSTVIHALRAVEQRMADDPYTEIEVEVLRERLTATVIDRSSSAEFSAAA